MSNNKDDIHKLNLDEANLISGIKQRDENCFATLYDMYIHDLFSYAQAFSINREYIKDLVQDVFCNFYFSDIEFKSLNHIKYYLIKSLKNNILNFQKRESKKQSIEENDFHFTINNLSSTDNYFIQEEEEILNDKINTLLSSLTTQQKEAIYLRFFQELDYDQISEILNITPTSGRKLVSRAIINMRKRNPSIYALLTFI